MSSPRDRQLGPPAAATGAERAAVLDLVAAQQARPDAAIVYLGTERSGIEAELEVLEPAWLDTARVVRDGRDGLVGAVLVEHDGRRAWIHGPWVADGGPWDETADALVDAALAQLPPAVVEAEVSGGIDHERLAALAARRSWSPSAVNHALVLDVAVVAGWSDGGGPVTVRAATPADRAAVEPLHEAEFPASYFDTAELLARAGRGEQVVLVAEDPAGAFLGYAAGRIQPDGEGYVDFLAVDPSARGTGAGRTLMVALGRELAPRSATGRICLTVQDGRVAARSLYERLGFETDLSFVAYRGPAHPTG
jgi:ribosomal protein S18 acetylase RimI-like enzyme